MVWLWWPGYWKFTLTQMVSCMCQHDSIGELAQMSTTLFARAGPTLPKRTWNRFQATPCHSWQKSCHSWQKYCHVSNVSHKSNIKDICATWNVQVPLKSLSPSVESEPAMVNQSLSHQQHHILDLWVKRNYTYMTLSHTLTWREYLEFSS